MADEASVDRAKLERANARLDASVACEPDATTERIAAPGRTSQVVHEDLRNAGDAKPAAVIRCDQELTRASCSESSAALTRVAPKTILENVPGVAWLT